MCSVPCPVMDESPVPRCTRLVVVLCEGDRLIRGLRSIQLIKEGPSMRGVWLAKWGGG